MGFGSDKTGFYKPSAVTVTASGNPLTLQNAKRLRKLTIYGNAVQDGTPSPDAPVEVQLCGDKTGNLMDITQISGPQIEVADNKIYLSGDGCSTNISPEYFLEMTGLNPGDTITCSNDTEIIHGVANSILGRVSFSNLKGGGTFILRANTTRTSTIPSDFNNGNYGNMILYGAQSPDESGELLAVMSNLAIYKGSYTADTLPAYEPYGYKVSGRAESDGQPPQDFAVYLPEQIAKVGDVADEVVVDMESKTAELRKNVGSVVADGEESWLRGTANYDKAEYTNRYAIFSAIKGDWRTPGPLCDKFEREFGNTWDSTNYECFNVNIQQLHLNISNTRLGITADDEASDRTTKFKAWLNDNNVTVYAPLAEPVTTDITSLQQWDAMPQVSGTVTLTLSAEVEPSGAEAVYTATKRPKAQAHGADAVR